MQPEQMEVHNQKLQQKFEQMSANEVRYEEMNTEDAEYLFVAYGLCARICQKAMDIAREKGIKAGLLRPITLFPYPYQRLHQLADQAKLMLSVELNSGQMIEDVRLGVNGKVPVEFYGRLGGMMPTPESIVDHLQTLIQYRNVN
jgi:2-oxoglutarate/2-oxoacid ferredoxin oxidoreductase subunit alpha